MAGRISKMVVPLVVAPVVAAPPASAAPKSPPGSPSGPSSGKFAGSLLGKLLGHATPSASSAHSAPTSAAARTVSAAAPLSSATGPVAPSSAPIATSPASPAPPAAGTSLRSLLATPAATAAAGPPSYWLAGSQGGVGAYGGADFAGSMAAGHLAAPVVGMARTPDGRGYWLVASDGGIFSFGDANFWGSMGGKPLAQPVVGMASTPDGRGYWLVASDGGIFAFGDAPFSGSMGGQPLARPMVGMAATPDGGYWTVAADGGMFSFGGAPFWGSMGGRPLAQPVTGMAATPDGLGYWLVASDGGIFAFGDAPFRGSAAGYVPFGEWISALAEGPGNGSTSAAGDFLTKVIPAGAPYYAHAATGYDISWPQCGGAYPPSASVAVVGVNGGSAFTANPCFQSEAAWGGPGLTVYLNLNSPQGSDPAQWIQGPAGTCAPSDLGCQSYNYGFNTAANSIAVTHQAGHNPNTWWLDVETGNYWTSDTGANDQVIAGALAALRQGGYAAAIYSTAYQWSHISGGYVPSVPVWYPTGQATPTPNAWCSASSFAGGPVVLVQSAAGPYDGDYSC
ncbi:MAG TPA: hypothetical protein VKR22_04430 [Acidimicrobiales bacterium]|nr:hypothetical protein [Acidimicrobiales bacterium]